jgi:hypothetical protein
LVQETGANGGGNAGVKVAVIKDHDWILSSKLQGQFLVEGSRVDDDVLCCLRSASE